jgi:hypothetical protein
MGRLFWLRPTTYIRRWHDNRWIYGAQGWQVRPTYIRRLIDEYGGGGIWKLGISVFSVPRALHFIRLPVLKTAPPLGRSTLSSRCRRLLLSTSAASAVVPLTHRRHATHPLPLHRSFVAVAASAAARLTATRPPPHAASPSRPRSRPEPDPLPKVIFFIFCF